MFRPALPVFRLDPPMPAPLASGPAPSVLIVDSSSDNREVLRTVLERRGLKIFEADEPERGLALAREHHPNVIVLDMELPAASASEVEDQYGAEAAEQHASLVIVGKASRSYSRLHLDGAATEIVAKPYHFAPLVHTIELLAAKAA
jgi:CheY-like chemotaxis protein